ncbi:MAG TPA: YfhO family protein [Bryobacteraceae bacterium]|nr:YfhO family protein [Bryobacteraceae bacterium]
METLTPAQAEPAGSTRVQGMLRNAGVPVLLALIIIGFYWKLTLTRQYTWLESPDLTRQVLPWQNVQALAFRHGQFPAWDPYLWGGQSLIGQAQPGSAYPLNWILYALPLRDGHIRQNYLHWYMALIHVMAALFGYWLCRDLERSRMASMIGGTAFALAGEVGSTDWPQMLNGEIWAPLVFLFLFRALRGRRPLLSAGLCGFSLGMAWLAGHHQVPIFLTYATGGVWLFYLLREKRMDWDVAKLAGVFAVFLALTSALQVMPAYEYGKLAKRWVGTEEPVGWKDVVPYNIHGEHSLGLVSVFGLVIPGVHAEVDPYVGFVILALAGLGLALWWSDVRVRILLVVGLAGLFFALGRQNVMHGFLYAVLPMLEKARTAAMAVFLLNFGLAMLAAYGFDGLVTRTESEWPRRIGRWTMTAGLVMIILMGFVLLAKQLHMDYDDRPVLVALVGLLLGALILGYQRAALGTTALGVFCLLLLLMDLGNVAGYSYPHVLDANRMAELRRMGANQDMLAWLRAQPGPFRIAMDSNEIPYNYGDWNGVEVFGGYTASLPVNLLRIEKDEALTLDLYGTKYWIGRTPRDPGEVEVRQFQSGLKAYERPQAFPRVWTVHETVSIPDENGIPGLYHGPRFDARRQAFFIGDAPKLSPCAGEDRATLDHHDFSRVAIQAQMQCAGMVILSDNWFPGWTATVDGQAAKIWEADAAIRGVKVPAGTHRIEMRYRPWSVRLGALMLMMSLAGLAALAWWRK